MISKSVRRLKKSKAAQNAAASYLLFFSTMAWGLISIPIAVKYLTKEEVGLWAIVSSLVTYMKWMDLGASTATGRLIADPYQNGDQEGMNQWWSASFLILCMQGLIVVLLSSLVALTCMDFFNFPLDLRNEAQWLIIGCGFMVALGFPQRGAMGLLVAQERAYLKPLINSAGMWINFFGFYFMLKGGVGIMSYLYSFAIAQVFTMIAYRVCVLTGPCIPRLSRKGLNKANFRRLLSFSTQIGVAGMSDVFIRTLPNLLLARVAAITVVPVYNFSAKGPILGSQIITRTYRAFYPGLQKLYVRGRYQEFFDKFHRISKVTVCLGIAGSGFILALNPVAVELLSSPDFYAGDDSNIWFALTSITIPVGLTYRSLLSLSGQMSRYWLVGLLKCVVAVFGGYLGWQQAGLEGVALVMALIPLMDGAYGYVRGMSNCGHHFGLADLHVMALTTGGAALTFVFGKLSPNDYRDGPLTTVLNKPVHLPDMSSLIYPSILMFAGGGLACYHVHQLLKQNRLQRSTKQT